MLFWKEQGLICFKFRIIETRTGSSNIKDISKVKFQPQIPFLNQSMCICKAGLSNLRHLDGSDFNQITGKSSNSKPKLTTL